MKNNDSNFENLYKSSVQFCDDNKIGIPVTKQRIISTQIDCSSHIQNIFNVKECKMRRVYYTTLDNMIVALNNKFDQETIYLIKNIYIIEFSN